ncbi:MAG: DUF2971 domain-containing protein [Xanthobacteraceae bacterium]
MTRLFKYCTASTAKIVLESRSVRWSSPKLFNDPFDLQFDLHLEYDELSLKQRLRDELWAIYSHQKPLNARNSFGQILLPWMQTNPGLSRDSFESLVLGSSLDESLGRANLLLPSVHADLRNKLVGTKVLCLSELHDNILMWSHYSGNHTGAVLEFHCDDGRQHVLHHAEPVRYRTKMPRLMDEDAMVEFFSGQLELSEKIILDETVYVKATDWAYEKEWRLVWPSDDSSRNFVDVPFEGRDLVGVYFGCRMSQADFHALRDIICGKYSQATMYLAKKSQREFALVFDRVN